METEKPPKGVVAILVRPDGHPPVAASHFEAFRPGGYKLAEAQKHYAYEAATRKLVDEFVGWPIRKAISDYDARGIVEKLIAHHGWKLHYELIGYEGEDV